MKHFILAAALLFGAVSALRAAEAAQPSACGNFEGWTFISIAFVPGVPSESVKTPVCGVKVGVPISTGEAPVAGVDCAVFYAGTRTIYGLQASLIANGGDKVNGVQFGIINFADEVDGVQIGVFNSAKAKSFQFGLINHIEGAWLPWCPFVNFKF